MQRTLLPLLLVSNAAAAQAVVLDINGADGVTVGAESCADTITVNYRTSVSACSNFKIWLAESTCGDEPAAADVLVREMSPAQLSANRTGTVSFVVSDLPMFKMAACPRPGTSAINKICASVKSFSGFTGTDCTTYQKSPKTEVAYDALPPAAPSLISVSARSGGLGLEVHLDADVAAFRIEAAVAGSGAWTESTGTLLIGTPAIINNLANNVAYDVRVFAEDDVGNASAASNVLQGTPVESCGFPCQLGDTNVDGGCSSAGGFALLPGLLSLWLVRRRRQ